MAPRTAEPAKSPSHSEMAKLHLFVPQIQTDGELIKGPFGYACLKPGWCTFWVGGQGARPAAGRVIHKQLKGVDLRLHMAGMPVVVPVVLVAKATGEDLNEGCSRAHEKGVDQPRPMHAHLPDIMTWISQEDCVSKQAKWKLCHVSARVISRLYFYKLPHPLLFRAILIANAACKGVHL